MHAAPVQTESGERARARALAVLEPRYAELDRRSRAEFRFSELERQHMEALALTIATLQGMAPVAGLEPSRDDGRLRIRS
jgi:hypothetical protein